MGSSSATKVTWTALVQAEPRLGALLWEIRAIKGCAGFCANGVWYGPWRYRQVMIRLVGDARKGHPVLGTSTAYDVAYEKLYYSLPDCDHDGYLCTA